MMFKNKRKISLFVVSSRWLLSLQEVMEHFHDAFDLDSILRLCGDQDV
jgi:hypothetical protein